MASGALKMARERLVANVKGGKFGPRAIFFRFCNLHPPLLGHEMSQAWQNWVIWDISGPPSFFGHFFGPRPKVF